MKRAGRALGSGKLVKVARGNGDHAWLLDWRGSDGTRRRKYLGQDRRNAERQRIEIVRQRDLELAGLATIEGQSRDLHDVAEHYLQDMGTRCKPRHVLQVRQRLDRVIAQVQAPRVRDLKVYHLTLYRTSRLAAGGAPRTVNHEVGTLRAMLNWSVRAGLIVENPIQAIRPLPIRSDGVRHQRRALSEEEIARFLAAAREDDAVVGAYFLAEKSIQGGSKGSEWEQRPRTPRIPQFPLWLSFLVTGARYFEMTRVRWADVDLTTSTMTLRADTTKNGKRRDIPLPENLVREIVALRPVHERVLGRPLTSQDFVFLGPEGGVWQRASANTLILFRRILERAGIERVNDQKEHLDLHALRHSCATRLANGGVPITHTQKLLGHSTIELTAKYYTHIGVDDLRSALEKVAVLR